MSAQKNAAIEERLAKALEFSNYRSIINRQMENAKMRFQNSLSYSKNGGTFKISPELISYLGHLVASGKQSVFILDIYDRAIEISNTIEFRDDVTEAYQAALNDYMVECDKLRKMRNLKSLTED